MFIEVLTLMHFNTFIYFLLYDNYLYKLVNAVILYRHHFEIHSDYHKPQVASNGCTSAI